jgi:uncharacterized protein YcnI
MEMQLRHKLVIGAAALVAAAFPAAAGAHVVVEPGEVETESFVTFTMSVPNEKDNPTTKVSLIIPKSLVVYSVEAVPGWEWRITRTKGRISRLTVRGNLPPGYFQRFSFVAATPAKATVLLWRATQTYEDGSVVRWFGPPSAESPASRTVVVPAEHHEEGHGHG